MAEDDADQTNSGHRDVTRISARLTTPLYCAVGQQRGNLTQDLLVVTLGEPDGSTHTIAFLPEDAPRLRRMIEEIESETETWQSNPKQARRDYFQAKISRSERLVKFSGTAEYLEKLKLSKPPLGNYIENQLKWLSRSVDRHVQSPQAARSLKQRITTAILVAVDCARWPI
jgi:hypothetical protein